MKIIYQDYFIFCPYCKTKIDVSNDFEVAFDAVFAIDCINPECKNPLYIKTTLQVTDLVQVKSNLKELIEVAAEEKDINEANIPDADLHLVADKPNDSSPGSE